MLTPAQRSEYGENGYVRLPRGFSRADAAAMADFIWARLSDLHGMRRDDRATWSVAAPWAGLNRFKDDPVFQPLHNDTTFQAIDDLIGADGWKKPRNWGGFLVKFPDAAPAAWTLPLNAYWHVDFHFTFEPGTPFGLRVFTLLSDVTAHGGGTLIVRGSHRLVERFVASLAREERQSGFAVLRDRFNWSHPWLARLTSAARDVDDRVDYFMNRPAIVDGQQVLVEELCAEPGDVILMHPWLLHAASPNASDRPRFMLAKDIYAEAVHAH